MKEKLRNKITQILKRHAPRYGALDAEVSFRESESLLSVSFDLKFKEGLLHGMFMASKLPDPNGLHPVVLYVFLGAPPKEAPPWTTVENREGIYSLRIGHLAKRGELLEAIERLYLHMASLGERLEPKMEGVEA